MVSERSIIIEVSPEGKITVRADGFIGPECEEVVRRMAEALGVIGREEHLPEFYLSEQEKQAGGQKVGGGW